MEVCIFFLQRPKRIKVRNNKTILNPNHPEHPKFMNFLQALQKKQETYPNLCGWKPNSPPSSNPLALPLPTPPSLRCNSNRLSTPLMVCNSSKGGGLEHWKFFWRDSSESKNPWIFWSREGVPSLKLTANAHENHHRNPGKYHQNGGFSMAMLVYRSVTYTLQSLTREMMLGKDPASFFRGYKYISFRGRETVLTMILMILQIQFGIRISADSVHRSFISLTFAHSPSSQIGCLTRGDESRKYVVLIVLKRFTNNKE